MRPLEEILEAVASNDTLTDEEALFLSIWEIIVRPDPVAPAISA